jgi:hypothetical protein
MLEHTNPEHRPERGTNEPTQRPVSQPMADREVPLSRHATPAMIHAWLDGDIPEADARLSDMAHDVEFWRRIDREVEARRQVRAPVTLYESLMQALPQTTPRVITPWWRRPFEVTPSIAAIATLGLIALGMAVGIVLLRM